MLLKTIQFQLKCIKNNISTFLITSLIAFIVLYVGYIHDTIIQAISYLATLVLCIYIIDLFTLNKSHKFEIIVRNPRKETFYFIATVFLGLIFLYFRFSKTADWEHINGLARLVIIPLIIFVFPIGLAIIMLLLKYKPKDLGLRTNGVIQAIPIILIFALVNRLICPESLTFDKLMEESGGSIWMLFSGFIMAGLSEEFFRVIGQTRIGAFLKNNGLGWILTSTIWALLHGPKWYGESNDLTEVLLSCCRIIPLGLMWGYLTHRTKNFLPATIVHGMNIWGLQNF